jgi:exodeoxyribonuclease VII large subunit
MAIYSVSQITSYLQEKLNQDLLLSDVWIRGEVSNLTQPGSGHSYFSLTETSSTLRCAMFRRSTGNHLLSNGVEILAHGRISIYEARGDIQLIVDLVQPEGIGDLKIQIEQLKLRLENEGLFDPLRKRSLPPFPKAIGVVTSPSGSVWHDIQTVISRRYPMAELILAPTTVQGDDAPQNISYALQALNEMNSVDVIILARGGGSVEDLSSFNEESVARTIFGSKIPVITGLGHETNLTISDLVADQYAPTPSAAAELTVPDKTEIFSTLVASQQTQTMAIMNLIQGYRNTVHYLAPRVKNAIPRLDQSRLHIDELLTDINTTVRQEIDSGISKLDSLLARLNALSPKSTLERGYAIVESSQSVIRSASALRKDDQINVTLASGNVEARVTSVRHSEETR